MPICADACPMPQVLHLVTRFVPELFGLLAVGLFVANMMAGKRSNEALAIKWARTFCGDGAVLERNFAQIIARADGSSEVPAQILKRHPEQAPRFRRCSCRPHEHTGCGSVRAVRLAAEDGVLKDVPSPAASVS